MTRPSILFLGTALAFYSGCHLLSPGPEMATGLSPAEVKQVLKRRFDANTSLDEARTFMEREGFQCEFTRNASFSENGTDHTGIDYLFCTRPLTFSQWDDQPWQIALVVDNGMVVDVLVSSAILSK